MAWNRSFSRTAFADSVHQVMAVLESEENPVLYREQHELEFKVDHGLKLYSLGMYMSSSFYDFCCTYKFY